jgi:hypothetical protein
VTGTGLGDQDLGMYGHAIDDGCGKTLGMSLQQ